jgi:hypothetical protein
VNPRDLVLWSIRSGLRSLGLFNLPVALFGLAGAVVINPTASADELAVLVAVPLPFFVLLMRAFVIWRPQPQLTPQEIEKATRLLKELFRKFPWLLPATAGVWALAWAIGSLLAVPIYLALRLDTALVLYGFVWAGMLFGLGVLLCAVALYLIHPSLLQVLVQVAVKQVLEEIGTPFTKATSFMASVLRAR